MDLNKRDSKVKEIVFGPGDKLWFLEQVAQDSKAIGIDSKVAVALANRVDKFSGTATVGQPWIASYVGASERHVRRSIYRLCRLGHLSIEHIARGRALGGRHLANIYRLRKRTQESGPNKGDRVADGVDRTPVSQNPDMGVRPVLTLHLTLYLKV